MLTAFVLASENSNDIGWPLAAVLIVALIVVGIGIWRD